jgi:hypothetical protein
VTISTNDDDAPTRWSDQGPNDDLWNWLDLTSWIAGTYPGDSLDLGVTPTVVATPSGLTCSAVQINLSNGTFLGTQISGGIIGQDYRVEFFFALVNGGSLHRPVRLFIGDL